MTTTTIGVLGGSWRAEVTPWGSVIPGSGAPLDWWVAADDRWHDPAAEKTVRQVLIDGAPVVETRVRVPQGDVIQRVYAVADHGGLTVIELENDSPLPVAVAFSRSDVLTTRPPTDMPIEGITLPAGSIAVPIGHHATVQVALAHTSPRSGLLPTGLPTSLQVARGWLAQMERASRLVLPDSAVAERVVRERCDLVLNGIDDPTDDAVGFLLGTCEFTRLGWSADEWLPDIAGVASSLAASIARRGGGPRWDEDRALLAAGHVFSLVSDPLGVRDVAAVRSRLGARSSAALQAPAGIRAVAWIEDSLARPTADGAVLMPDGHRDAWLGQSAETYGLPAPGGRSVSFALRWHGERPAVLWEVTGPSGLTLTSGCDPTWSTSDPKGEGLWSPPPA